MEFTLFDCKIKIDFLFVLVLCVSALFSAKGLLYVLLFSMLHEAGHLIMLLIVGGRADMLTFSYYGVALKYESKLNVIRELPVIAAGPLINLILYLIIRDDYNLLLFAVNMLPVFPLDAGRILQLFSYSLSVKINYAIIFALVIPSVYMLIKYNSFSMLLITIYLIIYSINY